MSRLRIAHLSDPHFGTILPGTKEGLLASLAELKPELILITGDITQRARRSQFRDAKAFTHQLRPVPIIAVPGNHDIPLYNLFARLFNPYRGFKKLFKDQLEKDFVHGDVSVTGLNSTSRWRHVQGRFDLARLERRLRQKPRGTKVHIACFHHPMDCRKPQDEKNLLKDREAAIKIFDQSGVDLLIGGHIHDPYVSLSKVRFPDTRRNMIIGVAGTCLSWRIRPGAPNSFHLIDVDTSASPRLVISRHDQRDDQKFTLEHVHKFHCKEGEGWAPD